MSVGVDLWGLEMEHRVGDQLGGSELDAGEASRWARGPLGTETGRSGRVGLGWTVHVCARVCDRGWDPRTAHWREESWPRACLKQTHLIPGPRCWRCDLEKGVPGKLTALVLSARLPPSVSPPLYFCVSPHMHFLSIPSVLLSCLSALGFLLPLSPFYPVPCSQRTRTCPTRRPRGRPTSTWSPRTSSRFSSEPPSR